ncbi:putative endochitinase [Folsomia candida]|uniref:Putative endochitinase n=1 Tax=Folsomia candida TaxID=158441 RepID=A0A226DQB8_FOLCA|nr:putative endochitinase [Folsomia candida]
MYFKTKFVCGLITCYFVCISSMVTKTDLSCTRHGHVSANPSNCSSFYQCDNGTIWIIACQKGLYFNPRSSMCDKPRNVDCNIFPSIPHNVHIIPSRFECYTCSYFQTFPNSTTQLMCSDATVAKIQEKGVFRVRKP